MKTNATSYFKQTLTMALVVIPLLVIGQKRYSASEYKLTISGTSTIHDWEIEAEKVSCSAEMIIGENNEINISTLKVVIPVESLESGKGIMNNKTYDALKSEDHPNISFAFLSLESQSGSSLKVNGNLTIAGKTKPIVLDAAITKTDERITFKGVKELLMTSYSVEPPTALMGTIKTDDLVKVKFEIQLSKHNNS